MTLKRKIFSIKVQRIVDKSPDTSYLGEYAKNPTSEYSIDRMHSEDCQSVDPQVKHGIEILESIIGHLDNWRLAASQDPDNIDWEDLDESIDTLIELQEGLQECDCGGNHVSSREYRYFNPSFNYVGRSGELIDGNTSEEVRKYVREDYDRMESLNTGHWCYIGIRAVAEVGISTDGGHTFKLDKLTAGGLWGIESDSDRSYLESVERDELADLKDTLKAYGFGRSTIAKAFSDVKRED